MKNYVTSTVITLYAATSLLSCETVPQESYLSTQPSRTIQVESSTLEPQQDLESTIGQELPFTLNEFAFMTMYEQHQGAHYFGPLDIKNMNPDQNILFNAYTRSQELTLSNLNNDERATLGAAMLYISSPAYDDEMKQFLPTSFIWMDPNNLTIGDKIVLQEARMYEDQN